MRNKHEHDWEKEMHGNYSCYCGEIITVEDIEKDHQGGKEHGRKKKSP